MACVPPRADLREAYQYARALQFCVGRTMLSRRKGIGLRGFAKYLLEIVAVCVGGSSPTADGSWEKRADARHYQAEGGALALVAMRLARKLRDGVGDKKLRLHGRRDPTRAAIVESRVSQIRASAVLHLRVLLTSPFTAQRTTSYRIEAFPHAVKTDK
jgi:hypothetical protein